MSIDEAVESGLLDPRLDAAVIEAARTLADKIDVWDVIVEWAKDDAHLSPGARPAVPQNDNVSLASFLKYLDQMGLTPAVRSKASPQTATTGGSTGGRLGDFQAAAKRKAQRAG